MSEERRAPKRSRRREPLDDDTPLSFFAMLMAATPRGRKKATRPRKAKKTSPAKNLTPTEVITLEDTPEETHIQKNVQSKVCNFLTSGGFISSDDDETEGTGKSSPMKFVLSDDSDIEDKLNRKKNCDVSGPSTSAVSSGPSKAVDLTISDDIMEIVNSVLDSNTSQDQLNDMKSLEDYRKETEEMLNNAATLLDELKTKPKKEPKPQVTESPNKVTVSACPICLESLGGLQAAVTLCGHIFCKPCITLTAQKQKKCPTCRKAINMKKIHPVFL